jgi:hypothetical protein
MYLSQFSTSASMRRASRARKWLSWCDSATNSLAVELAVVDPHERLAEPDRGRRAGDRIEHRHDEQSRADRPEHAREREHAHDGVERQDEQGQRLLGEGLDVVGDALVGVGDVRVVAEAVVEVVAQVTVDEPARQVASPREAETLLDPAGAREHERAEREHDDIAEGMACEVADVPVGQRRHPVAAHVARDHVEPVDAEQHCQQADEQPPGRRAAIGGEEVANARAEAHPDGRAEHRARGLFRR